MTPYDPLYFLYLGLVFGIGFTGIVVGLLIIWKGRPKRNCDIGTPVEQYYRFEDYHVKHSNPNDHDGCKGCPLGGEMKVHDCRFVWMNMPYTKEAK